MKFFKIFIAIITLIVATSNISLSAHYNPITNVSDNNMSVVLPAGITVKIGDTPVSIGDEIGIFKENGDCVGALTWTDNATAAPVQGWADLGNPNGPKQGDELYFRIWDATNSLEYTSVTVTVNPIGDLRTPDTKYVPGGIMEIVSIIAATLPGKPSFTNPINMTGGVPLSGTITIDEGAGADEHTIQLSDENDFSNIIASANGDVTSLTYSNLSNNTRYYARARGTNDEGDGSWESISFVTIMLSPELSLPADNSKNLTESVKVEWNGVSAATSYTVQLSTDPNFVNNVETNSTGMLKYRQFDNLNNGTTYYWRVMVESNNSFSEYSDAFSFTTRLGATTITSPVHNSSGIGTNGTVEWTAVNGATAYNITITKVQGNIQVVGQNTTNTYYEYTNLEPYTDYVVKVFAKNDDGNGAQSTANFRTIFGSPTLISPDNGSSKNDFSLTFSWNAVAGADKYDLRISTTFDFSANVINQTDINGTSYTYGNFDPNTTYYWQVRGTSVEGVGGYSTYFGFTTKLDKATIITPANNAKQIALENTSFEWTNVPGATQYEIQISDDPAFGSFIYNGIRADNPFILSGFSSKTDYYARVKAINANNEGDYSDVVKFTTRLGKVTLSSPANGSYVAPLSGTLNWQNLQGADSYNLVVSTNSDLSNPIVNTNQANNSYNYNGFTKNTKYYWQVSGVDIDGAGEPSDLWSFTTILGEPVLTLPADNAIAQEYSNLQLEWNLVASASKYHVQVSRNMAFTNLVVDDNNVNATSLVVPSLNPNTSYYWRVKALSLVNSGDFSAANTFTTKIGQVTLSSPSNGGEGFSTTNGQLSWINLSGATSYDVLVSENPDLSNPLVNTNTVGTSYNIPNGLLNTSSVYYWAVRGKDANGNFGDYSNTFAFGTLLTAPTLTSPNNGATDVAFNELLKWNSVTRAASYNVTIAKDPAFNNIVLNQDANSTQLVLSSLESSTTYYWRVAGVVNFTLGNYSSVFSFKTMSLPPPELLYPRNFAQDLYTNVDFVWVAVQEAIAYNFRYASDPNMQNVLGTTNNIVGTTHNQGGLFANRAYYWQVQTVSNDGVSNWSDAYQFNTYGPISFNGEEHFCENREATYTAPSSDYVDYKWTVTGGTINGSSTNHFVKVEWGSTGLGVVTLTRSSDIWDNYTDQLSMEVEITPTNTVNANLSVDTYYGNNLACLYETITLSTDLADNDIIDYYWMLNGQVISTQKSFDYQFTTDGTHTIEFYGEGSSCKAISTSIDVEVSDHCSLTASNMGDITTCKNSAVQLFIDVFGGSGVYTYSWSPASDFINPNNQNPLISKASVTKTYTATVTDAVTQRQAFVSVKVTVSATPTIKFNPTSLMVYTNQAIDLTDEHTVLTTISGGTAPYSYYWTDDFGNPIDPTNVIPDFGRNYYHLTVADANGCESSSKRFIVYNMSQKGFLDDNFVIGVTGDGLMMNYPNPVTDNLNIFVDFETKQNVRVRIMNMIGQNVYQESLGNTDVYEGQIHISHLSSGVYTIIVESDVNSFVNTFIKQ